MNKVIIGIDAGKNGGIAWIKDGKACAEKMPETCQDLWDLIRDITNYQRSTIDGRQYKAYLEQVHVAPSFAKTKEGKENTHRMGAKSAFTFGNGFGHLEMALIASSVPFERVSPQRWQKCLGCLTKGDKNVSKRKAQELFPNIKITHAIADALLIAEYGLRQQITNQ